MKDEDKVDSVFVKGFNEGYVIAQNMPELAEVLANVKSNGERLKGLKAGQKQYIKEQIQQIRSNLPIRSNMPSWLKSDRSVKDKNSPAKSKGRDIEPDRE